MCKIKSKCYPKKKKTEKETRIGLVVRGLDRLHKVIGSNITNNVTKKNVHQIFFFNFQLKPKLGVKLKKEK